MALTGERGCSNGQLCSPVFSVVILFSRVFFKQTEDQTRGREKPILRKHRSLLKSVAR